MILFAYGTLLDERLRANKAGRRVAATPATLRGWRRVRLAGSRFLTLRRAPAIVPGAILRIDARAARGIAAWEGPRYQLRPVCVRLANRTCRALVWIAPGGVAASRSQPST